MSDSFARPPRRGLGAAATAAVAFAACALCSPTAPAHADGAHGPSAFTLKDPRITESSGLAVSHAHPGIYWTHNDSDDGPYVYAVDSRTGKTVATVTLRGVTPRDVEAISVGPDGDVYVGDIGDNLGGRWKEVWIYRFHEPKTLHDVTVDVTRYTVRYADGPRNAESLMVHPVTGRVYIASKSEDGKGGLYAGPRKLSPTGVNVFHRVAPVTLWATDGAFSPDGTRLVLRSYFGARMYAWKDGAPKTIGPVDVPVEQQGESVTFTPDGRTLMFGSEGADSRVQPIELTGKLLPERAAARAAAQHGKDTGSADASGAAPGAQAGDEHTLALGAGTFVGAVVLWLGMRRIFRRRG
jgi:WD40 repeat protein